MGDFSGARAKHFQELRAGRGQPPDSYQKLQATFEDACAAWQQARSSFDSARRRFGQRRLAPGDRQELLRHSPYARLIARLETMPTIEQAKGIIMAQSHCPEGQAFDALRRASQRLNVPVRDLAAQVVARTVHRSQAEGPAGDRRGHI
jgi:hypothetical protein